MKTWTGPAATALVVVAAAYLSPLWIPFNMDEFVHYHSLGCAQYPLSQKYNQFREGCAEYALQLPFTRRLLPLRSYLYIGSLPTLPFYVFWRVFDAPVAARVQGACFFLIASLLACRFLRVSWPSILVASLIFPVYLAAFVVDTGPVGISITILMAALVCIRKAAEVQRPIPRALWGGLVGFACFLGIFVKLVFAWCVPAVAVIFLVVLRRAREGGLVTKLGSLAAAAVLFAGPTLLLLFAKDVEGNRYYQVVSVGHITLEPQSARNVSERLGEYFMNGSAIAPRTIRWPGSPLDGMPAILSLVLLIGTLSRPSARRGEIACYAALSLITFLVMVLTRSAWAAHHFVFALVFLVMSLSLAWEALPKQPRVFSALALALLVLYWSSLALRWPFATINPDMGQAKDALLSFIRREGLDRRTVQVHTSWGTYYIAHLFGDRNQAVLFVKGFPDLPDRLGEVRSIADAEGRGVLLVSARDPERIQTPAVQENLGKPLRTYVFENWRAVEYLR